VNYAEQAGGLTSPSTFKHEAKDMLTLTNKDNETLHIGDDIKIVIKRASGAGNKVSIEAPTAVKILRDKLVQQS